MHVRVHSISHGRSDSRNLSCGTTWSYKELLPEMLIAALFSRRTLEADMGTRKALVRL